MRNVGGKYTDGFNWWCGFYSCGEHEVKNIGEVIEAVKGEMTDFPRVANLISAPRRAVRIVTGPPELTLVASAGGES